MFYERFCELCKKRGTTPTRIVKELGLSSGNMTNWKNGRVPKTEVASRIAERLGVTINALLGKEEPNTAEDVSDAALKFALFGGDGEITDEMLDEVKAFAEFVKNKYKKD